MKRTITFLLVLSISMTFFACTSKPKPDPFTPLSHPILEGSLAENTAIEIPLEELQEEVLGFLAEDSWEADDSLIGASGKILLTLTDDAGDVYRIYTSETNPETIFVIVKRDDDKQSFGFKTPDLDTIGLLQLLKNNSPYLDGLFKNSFIAVDDVLHPLLSSTNETVLSDLLDRLNRGLYRKTDTIPSEDTLRYILRDNMSYTYSIYNSSPNIVIVTYPDQTKRSALLNTDIISYLDQTLYERYLGNIYLSFEQPISIFLGQRSTYSTSKLAALPERAKLSFVDYALLIREDLIPIDNSEIDPNAKILYMTKNADLGYTTVYANTSTELVFDEWTFNVSIGPDPFHGPNNLSFKLFGPFAYGAFNKLALVELNTPTTLDFVVNTKTTYTFPFYQVNENSRPIADQGKLTTAMIDYLESLEPIKWTKNTPYYTEVFKLILTTETGVKYLFTDTGVYVDEDPSTIGATYFGRFDVDYDPIQTLEYYAQLAPDLDNTTLAITQFEIQDRETYETEWVTLTGSQSSALTTLIRESTWTRREIRSEAGGGGDYISLVVLKTSSAKILEFQYYEAKEPYDEPYVVLWVDGQGQQFYVPMVEFKEILTLLNTYR